MNRQGQGQGTGTDVHRGPASSKSAAARSLRSPQNEGTSDADPLGSSDAHLLGALRFWPACVYSGPVGSHHVMRPRPGAGETRQKGPGSLSIRSRQSPHPQTSGYHTRRKSVSLRSGHCTSKSLSEPNRALRKHHTLTAHCVSVCVHLKPGLLLSTFFY